MGTAARRIAYAIAGAGVVTLAAFASAAPAYADNGPHIMASGGSIAASPDSCAGCHRIHSGKASNWLFAGGTDQEAICESCHDGTGATTDVKDGVSTKGTSAKNTALRAGGFETSLMNTAAVNLGDMYISSRGSWSYNKFGDPANTKTGAMTIGVATAGIKTTSTHTMGTGTMWGAGTKGGGVDVELECSSCHNPHGNGNYRILNTVPAAIPTVTGSWTAASITARAAAVTKVEVADDAFGTEQAVLTNTTGPRYNVVFTTAAKHTIFPGMRVTVRVAGEAGNAPSTATTFTQYTGTVTSTTDTTFTMGFQTKPTAGWFPSAAVTATALANYPSTLVLAKGDGAAWTYTTAEAHGLYAGQVITVGSMNASKTDFIATRLVISKVPTDKTFQVAKTTTPATVGAEAGLYIIGIPDAVATTDTTGPGVPVGVTGYTKVYTTDNYLLADDHYYSGKYQANASFVDNTGATKPYTALSNGYIANVSQWCATCHTRYLAASNGRRYPNTVNGVVDTQFTFRHRSDYVGEGSPNCVTCHVAHGSTAQMSGAYSSTMTVPGATTKSASSRLLRLDNRGICITCHAAP